jgi:ABC-type transporter Mla MlaB component
LTAFQPASRQVVVGPRIERTDVAALCALLDALAASQPTGTIDVDVRALARCDLMTIDGLARLALAARRRGRSIRLICVPPELHELVALSGLMHVLPCRPAPSVEVGR